MSYNSFKDMNFCRLIYAIPRSKNSEVYVNDLLQKNNVLIENKISSDLDCFPSYLFFVLIVFQQIRIDLLKMYSFDVEFPKSSF